MNNKPSRKEKSSKKGSNRATSSSSRNNDKWYSNRKAEFGDVANSYKITKEVGRGAYGVVYEAYFLNPETKEVTNKRVAVKAFYNTLYPQLVLMEIYFLQLVKDTPNIVRLQNFMFANNQFFVMTDFYNSTHFEKIMYPEGRDELKKGMILASMIEIKSYLYSLLQGLAGLHELGVVHRDVKQGNFLYDPQTKEGVLIDFGLAEISAEIKAKAKNEEELPKKEIYKKIIDLQRKLGENKIGTEGFMPPEQVLKKDKQSYGVDIWAAGVIFLEFLTAKHTLFKNLRLKKEKCENQQQQQPVEYAMGFLCSLAVIFGRKKVEEVAKQCAFKLHLPSEIHEEQLPWRDVVTHPEFDDNTMDLLDKMVRLNPDERISSKDALSHPFFDEVRRTD